jgi:2-C-methyl-D-erythritol 4-phosphate cytidylyltransferase
MAGDAGAPPGKAGAGVVLAAAGAGRRFGGRKQFLELAGRPLLHWSLDVFAAVEGVSRVAIAVAPGETGEAEEVVGAWSPGAGRGAPRLEVVPGGERRQDSVRLGLESLATPGPGEGAGAVEHVLVHDAARPLLLVADARRVLAAVREHGAAVIGWPSFDSVKRVQDGTIIAELPRDEVWTVQTPQGARLADLLAAYRQAGARECTDEASALRAIGIRVVLVEGSRENLKITRPGDEALAARILAGRRGG